MEKLDSAWARKVSNIVKEKVPEIIEIFVEYYGEEYREAISNKFNNTFFVFTDISRDENSNVNSPANLKYRESVLDMFEEEQIIDIDETYMNMCNDLMIGGAAFIGFRLSNLTHPVPICFLPKLSEINDSILFHELNHIILSELKFEDGHLVRRMGLTDLKYFVDYTYNMVYNNDDYYASRNEELLNVLDEVINDYISLEIWKISREREFEFGSPKRLNSYYSVAFLPLESFFKEYMKEIKEAVLDGKREALTELFSYSDLYEFAQDIEYLLSLDNQECNFVDEWFNENNLNARKLMIIDDYSEFPVVIEDYGNALKDVKKSAAKAHRKVQKADENLQAKEEEDSSVSAQDNDENHFDFD